MVNTSFSVMQSDFFEFTQLIKAKLAAPLPGKTAHKIMMPEGRSLAPQKDIPPTPSAILIALYEKQGEIYFPVIRRTIYNGLHSGQMAFPGGKFETTDGSLFKTALRESFEEVGIEESQVMILGSLSPLYIPITNMEILPVVGVLKTPPDYKVNTLEVEGIYDVNIKDILNQSLKHNEKWNIRSQEIDVPFYNIQEQTIWGATAMILSEFEYVISEWKRNFI